MLVDPIPDHLWVVAIGASDVDGAAMTVTAGAAAASMGRVADTRLETGCEAGAIVVAGCAEYRPLDSGGVHGVSGAIELRAKLRIHSADHVILQAHAHALRGRRILPAEIAR